MKRPRFLCVCQNGNNRSVFLAFRLKRHGYEALAAGWNSTSTETFNMLCNWADRVVVMEQNFISKIPVQYQFKVEVIDVGPDKWGPKCHPELRNLVYDKFHLLQLPEVR